MSPTPYLRYPDLHENLVTFVAEDDVWVAPVGGGRAWRISSMRLPARNPRFSPDGTRLAWSVVQGTAPEVVTADVEGGDFRQLTYWGSDGTRMSGFNSAGHVIATSAFQQEDSRLRWAYQVPLDGSPFTRLPYGPVEAIAEGPVLGDERPLLIASVLSREPAWWKRYRGGTSGKLWLDAGGTGDFVRLVPELDGNLTDPMWVDGRVVFLSDHEGYGNLYSVTAQGTDLRRHTDFEEFYVRHASSDGRRIIFESAGRLWLLPSLEETAVPLDITLGAAATARRPRPLDVGRHLADVVPDTEGTASVVESHGTLHWLTHRDGPSRVIEADSAVRARLGRPLGADRAVYVSDAGGEEALYIRNVFADIPVQAPAGAAAPAVVAADAHLPQPLSAAGVVGAGDMQTDASRRGGAAYPGRTPNEAAPVPADTARTRPEGQPQAGTPAVVRVPFGTPTRVSALVASPNARTVAVATEYGDVFLLDVEAAELSRVAATKHGAVEELAFSPDSRWLVWAEPVASEGARSRIRITSADPRTGTAPIDVTDGRFQDHAPAFTPDGRYLAFLSERSFDPVYDTHRFDLSFPSSTKPFLVALTADTPSPFGPSVHGTAPSGRQDPEEAASGSGAGGIAVTVDPERIGERIIPVPVPQGRYERLRAVDNALLWLATDSYGVTGDGRASSADAEPVPRLERFDLAVRKVSVLVPELDSYEVNAGGTRVVYRKGAKVRAVPAASKTEENDPENIGVDLDRIRVQVDPVAVWGQAFDEAWRLQRDFFWAPDMGGLDWPAIHDRYRPLVQNLGSHDDLVDLIWEMHGELGTSHAYVRPQPVREAGAAGQGFLGADLRPGDGGWEVHRIFESESSDPQATSPLAAPGADVHPGDVIAAVDGIPVPAGQGPAALLRGAAGRTVELTVVHTEEGSEPEQRRIAVVPIRSEERLRYQTWVATNRRLVRAASNGAYGYLHIPDMVASGWSQLHRDLDQETARGALIIDVRRNRGGHTSQLVAELIGRRVTAWNVPRAEQPATYPAHAPRGPVVILADEFAGSDGDIITQVAKLRGIGPVVGTRTWGGVVGIDGRFTLVDGTGVNQPRYAFWFTGGVGWSVENYGVDPDIEVPFPPHAYVAGEDPQLAQAVAVLREMLAELPTEQPPAAAGYRSLQPAPLPPRPQGGDQARDQGRHQAGQDALPEVPRPVRAATDGPGGGGK